MIQCATPTVPTQDEICAMAAILMRRYGVNAEEVADHFILEHNAVGDRARAALWEKVRAILARNTLAPTLS